MKNSLFEAGTQPLLLWTLEGLTCLLRNSEVSTSRQLLEREGSGHTLDGANPSLSKVEEPPKLVVWNWACGKLWAAFG